MTGEQILGRLLVWFQFFDGFCFDIFDICNERFVYVAKVATNGCRFTFRRWLPIDL
jgi:hypothetical protein